MTKILLIEDEIAVREMLVDELSVNGYEVIEAVNGDDGLKKIIANTPDLIICDRAMAVCSGYQLLENLRKDHPEYNTIPFVFMTALTDPRDKEAVEHLKPTGYLEKPIDFAVLNKTIKGFLTAKK